MTALLCIGYGACAKQFVADFGARFDTIIGTSRNPAAAPGPVTVLPFDGVTGSPALRDAVARTTHLLISAAPAQGHDPVLTAMRDRIAAAPDLESIVYLSSIGVYGDHHGAWVDETAPTQPDHQRGDARVIAERAWQALGAERRTPVSILRLSGIYGPGQNAFTRLRAGRAHRIVKPGHVFNRIHTGDIAQAIAVAYAKGFDGIVNVTDDEPAPGGDPIAFAAELAGIAPPPEMSFEQAQAVLSPMALSFYSGCLRASNDKLKRELGVTLRYPTYREGLRALFEAGEATRRGAALS